MLPLVQTRNQACCEHPSNLLGGQKQMGTGVCPSPVSLHAMCWRALMPIGLDTFSGYPKVLRGCSSSVISSELVMGLVLPKGYGGAAVHERASVPG